MDLNAILLTCLFVLSVPIMLFIIIPKLWDKVDKGRITEDKIIAEEKRRIENMSEPERFAEKKAAEDADFKATGDFLKLLLIIAIAIFVLFLIVKLIKWIWFL